MFDHTTNRKLEFKVISTNQQRLSFPNLDQIQDYEDISKSTLKTFKQGELLLYQTVTWSIDYHLSGQMYLTNYKIYFQVDKKKVRQDIFEVPLGQLQKVDKQYDKRQGDQVIMEITTKDGRQLKFNFDKYEDANTLFNVIQKYQVDRKDRLFAFFFNNQNNQWIDYSIQNEFQRQQLPFEQYQIVDNQNGQICSSYFNKLIITQQSNKYLSQSVRCRNKERIPILCYYLKKTQLTLWRSAQQKQKNKESDDSYLKELKQPLHVFDITKNNIDPINKTRDSYKKMIHSDKSYHQIQNSQWYDQIVQLIQLSIKVSVHLVRDKQNVLAQCQDGQDRTSQVVSLALIMLDPYYRTIEGFLLLIKKEWIYAGYPFFSRSGYFNEDQQSPTFLQFLDCVYQLLNEYPLSFEFNQQLLSFIAYHQHSNLYGDFICDSYLEIDRFKIKNNTQSIESEILNNKEIYFNQFYKCTTEIGKERIIGSNFSGRNIKTWKEYFNRYEECDYYKIFEDCNFNNESINKIYQEYKKENNILLNIQTEQIKQMDRNEQLIKELQQIINQ